MKVLPGWILFFLFLLHTEAYTNEKKRHEPVSLKKAVFAGGCFWCMEPPFEKLPGVVAVVSGYAGGKEKNPTYDQVSSGQTSHIEAIEITYNEKQITYEQLLDIFWKNIDPTQSGGQFYDIGPQYRTVIFPGNKKEMNAALYSKKQLNQSQKFSRPVVTEIIRFSNFYPAEEYHQDYYKKNPEHYKRYRAGSGRDAFIRKHWPDYIQDK